MNMEVTENPAAFPVDTSNQYPFQEGMTLRDYFAGRALQMIVINDTSGRPDNFREFYSEGAYKWADAMLAARSKQKEAA